MMPFMLKLRSVTLLAAASLVACNASAQKTAPAPRFPNSEDLRHTKNIGGLALSPDGRNVLFAVTDATADGAKTHLWIAPVDGGPSRQLTYSPASDKRGESRATWAPDGSAIFFVARRGETSQLFRLPMAGGEAAPYDLKVVPAVDNSKEKDAIPPAKKDDKKEDKKDEKSEEKKDDKPEPLAINIGGYAPSPDGKWLAVWAEDPETPGEKKAKEAKADAVWVNHEKHGERLYLAALKPDGAIDGALKPVGIAPDVHDARWSRSSDRLVVLTGEPNDASDLGPDAKAWLVSISKLDQPEQLKNVPATARGGFSWSADDKHLVFAAQTTDDAPPGVEDLFLIAANGSGEVKRLTAGFKGSLGFGDYAFLPEGKVVAPVVIGTRMSIAKISLDGSSAPEIVPQATVIATSLATNLKQTGWVWTASASDKPEEFCYSATLGGECKLLSTPSPTQEKFRTVASKLVSWQNEGLTIEGLLYLPPDADTKKVPLIIDVHGGPLGAWEDRHDEWTSFLIGHGWAILRPNPRGSSGYGTAFAAANKNDLGGKDFHDIMTGLDYVLKNYPIDSSKLALMGYSYGGEMAGFAEGKTDRFKAIISGAPVIDQFSEYGTERESWYDRWYFGKPWEHMADAWRQSALSGVSKAKTPFLLLQGESDGTDPLGQSEEMYRALRQAGVPVDLVTYPREDHGPLARGIYGYPSPEPWHGFDGRQRIVQFLQKAFGEEGK
jgi:dipeptidyl aminopeptidase/acylaminoacyl peptidase